MRHLQSKDKRTDIHYILQTDIHYILQIKRHVAHPSCCAANNLIFTEWLHYRSPYLFSTVCKGRRRPKILLEPEETEREKGVELEVLADTFDRDPIAWKAMPLSISLLQSACSRLSSYNEVRTQNPEMPISSSARHLATSIE